MTSITETTLVMIVGPSAMGKSTIMNELVRMDNQFSRVRSFTTRPPRENDEPNHYYYLTTDELADKRSAGDVITETAFPSTGHIYGTISESFTGEYSLLDTLAISVEEYRELPFKATKTIALTASLDDWQNWLTQRFPKDSPDKNKRLEEAAISIDWCLQDDDAVWLVNSGSPAEMAAKLRNSISTGASNPTGPNLARTIRDNITPA